MPRVCTCSTVWNRANSSCGLDRIRRAAWKPASHCRVSDRWPGRLTHRTRRRPLQPGRAATTSHRHPRRQLAGHATERRPERGRPARSHQRGQRHRRRPLTVPPVFCLSLDRAPGPSWSGRSAVHSHAVCADGADFRPGLRLLWPAGTASSYATARHRPPCGADQLEHGPGRPELVQPGQVQRHDLLPRRRAHGAARTRAVDPAAHDPGDR